MFCHFKKHSPLNSLISQPTSWISVNQQFKKERRKPKQLILVHLNVSRKLEMKGVRSASSRWIAPYRAVFKASFFWLA